MKSYHYNNIIVILVIVVTFLLSLMWFMVVVITIIVVIVPSCQDTLTDRFGNQVTSDDIILVQTAVCLFSKSYTFDCTSNHYGKNQPV